MWPLAQDYGRVAKTWRDSDHEKERGRGEPTPDHYRKERNQWHQSPVLTMIQTTTVLVRRGKRKAYLALLFSRTSPS